MVTFLQHSSLKNAQFLTFSFIANSQRKPAKWFGKGNLFLCTIKFLFYGKIKMTSERNVSGSSCGINCCTEM